MKVESATLDPNRIRPRGRYSNTLNLPGVQDVNWAKNLNIAQRGFILSPVDASPKISCGYYDCTGVAAAGIHKATKKPFSFLTHQSPFTVSCKGEGKEFQEQLHERALQLKAEAEEGTIRAKLFAGMSDACRYQAQVALSREVLDPIFGEKNVEVVPTIKGDRKTFKPVHAALHTRKNRLYLFRGETWLKS